MYKGSRNLLTLLVIAFICVKEVGIVDIDSTVDSWYKAEYDNGSVFVIQEHENLWRYLFTNRGRRIASEHNMEWNEVIYNPKTSTYCWDAVILFR